MNVPRARALRTGTELEDLPLLRVLRAPEEVAALTLGEWDALLRQARASKLLARLALQIAHAAADGLVPPVFRDTLAGARFAFLDNQASMKWELGQIAHALQQTAVPVVLLKGAAYVAADLPPALGRLAGDVDILVPEAELSTVEASLIAAGWRHIKFSDYDQRYYRRWMHELPPLRHARRKTVIDVHHNILPRTSRLRPVPAKLWAAAVPLTHSRFSVLGPHDMVLHSATHLFHDGDLRFAIRDLVDVADLVCHFGSQPAFWAGLVARGVELELERPLFYALRYARLLLKIEIPAAVEKQLDAIRPRRAQLAVMDRYVPKVIVPGDPEQADVERRQPALVLYLRSHWIRMRPWQLLSHLVQKGTLRALASACQWWTERKPQPKA